MQADALQPPVGDVLHVLAEQVRVQTENPLGQAILGVGDFQFDGFFDHALDFLHEFRRPRFRVLGLDAVDQIRAEGQMRALVAHDVLELLADARHLVLPFER